MYVNLNLAIDGFAGDPGAIGAPVEMVSETACGPSNASESAYFLFLRMIQAARPMPTSM
jgi:hypothetical protein